MSYVKLFEDFHNLNEGVNIKEQNSYIKIKTVGKNLEISLASKRVIGEIQEMFDDQGDDCFYEIFEDIRANSELVYFSNLSDAGLGMSEANGIAYAYDMNDEGEYEETSESKLWYYGNYAVKSFVEELIENGKVIFTLAN